MENKKEYNIKAWNHKNGKWLFLGTAYLNAYDSQEQKDIEIEKLKKRFNVNFYLNISNFFNVYN